MAGKGGTEFCLKMRERAVLRESSVCACWKTWHVERIKNRSMEHNTLLFQHLFCLAMIMILLFRLHSIDLSLPAT